MKPPTSQPNHPEGRRKMTAPAYTNVPLPDATPHALTVEQAAEHVGRSPSYFRVTMSRLNHTEHDLRAPAQPGKRSRLYDRDKLDAWVAAGRPVPTGTNTIPTPKPDARKITATATHTNDGWAIAMDEIAQGTHTKDLRNAHRYAHAAAVEKTGLAPDEITIDLTITLPPETATQWAQAKKKEAEAKEAEALAARLSRQVVQDLQAQGCTYIEIGEMLGISNQRAGQLAKPGTGKES